MRAQTTQILIHTKIGVGIKKTRSFFLTLSNSLSSILMHLRPTTFATLFREV